MATSTFNYTGGAQAFTVPAGVTSLTVTADGAGGASKFFSGNSVAAGRGGRATCTVAVTPGEALLIVVGQAGHAAGANSSGTNAYGGGGRGGSAGGGGGYTGIFRSTASQANALCIGGGGGGAPENTNGAGGHGGGTSGNDGSNSPTNQGTGAGGTQTGGGAGALFGTAGTALQGGDSGFSSNLDGGGGGGGYYGGGGGTTNNSSSSVGGGGGGSGYTTGTGQSQTVGGGAGQDTNGVLTLTYNDPPNVPTSLSPSGAQGVNVVTFSAVVSDPNGGNVQAVFEIGTDGTNFPSGPYGGSSVASGGTSTYTFTGSPNTTYYLRARSLDPQGGYSTYTGVINFTTNRTPSVPVGVTPSGSINTVTPLLSASVTDPDGQNTRAYFQVSTVSNFASNIVFAGFGSTVASGAASTVRCSQLASGTTYYVRALAEDPAGLQSAYSAGVSFVTPPLQSVTYSFTGGAQSFTVPAGVTSLTCDAYGAGYLNPASPNFINTGGARVQGAITVTPGETVNIYVGGNPALGQAGYNGGGAPASGYNGGGGNGATDIRRGGAALANRVLVAGGGGGAGFNQDANQFYHGGAAGLNGTGGNGQFAGHGGGGGTQSAGGAGGDAGTGSPGNAGTLGTGGAAVAFFDHSGGGGGGYYGGGSGCVLGPSGGGGGGGGGSSLVPSGGTATSNARDGHGVLTMSYPSFNDAPNTAPGTPTSVTPSGTLTTVAPLLRANVSDPNGGAVRAYFQVSTNSGFTGVVFQGYGSTVTSGSTSELRCITLNSSQTYYVRALAEDPSTAQSAYSGGSTFTTPASITTTFSYTGADQSFTVPAGVTSITCDLYGAAGASRSATYHEPYYGSPTLRTFNGGLGGRTQGAISVNSGEALTVVVGQEGLPYVSGVASGGPLRRAYGGGGSGGGTNSDERGAGGGGASDIRRGTAAGNRLIVAAGGGGAGLPGDPLNSTPHGGVGGGTTGGNAHGGIGVGSTVANTGGGQSPTPDVAGWTEGTLGAGADAGSQVGGANGGGGGGYYGGSARTGDGGSQYSGGGGSALVPAGGSTTSGQRAGSGTVSLTYQRFDEVANTAPNTPVLTAPVNNAKQRGAVTAAWSYSDPNGHEQGGYAFRRIKDSVNQWWNGTTWVGAETYVSTATKGIAFPSSGFSAGTYTLAVRVTDSLGTPSAAYSSSVTLTILSGMAMII